MIKLNFLVALFVVFLNLGLANANESFSPGFDGTLGNGSVRCEEQLAKFYCECKILPGCGGQCWTPTYMRFDKLTGEESVVKYFRDFMGSKESCRSDLRQIAVCW